mmetsp:Transcript_53719/g.129387  ORF Transcript_53719/g.129387 Transcript_53719/m.129387 type:complete len:424 (+) Transcript_53719:67-1338(+)
MTRAQAWKALAGFVLAMQWCSSSTSVAGFLQTRLSGCHRLKSADVQNLRIAGAGGHGVYTPLRNSRTRLCALSSADADPEEGTGHGSLLSSPSALWWSLAGLTLAGASLGSQRRQVNVFAGWRARGIRRFKWKYGGDGPPKTPEWITKDRIKDEKSHGERVIPQWLTLQKWESFAAPNRARSVRWWTQAHDENGNPAFSKEDKYTIKDAVDKILSMEERAPQRFDPTMECMMVMNLDQKFPDQQVRCAVNLPHGTGKKVRVAVFCPMEEEEEVMALGAYKCGQKLAEDIEKEIIDFDVLLAKPQMMPRLAKLGKILGPRRLMPSPKSGTVLQDYAKGIKEFSGGVIELRTSKKSLINTVFGKASFGREKLVENLTALLQGLADKAPKGAKPEFWTQVSIAATMTPAVKILESDFPQLAIKTDG